MSNLLYVALGTLWMLCYVIYKKHKKICKSLPPGPPSLPWIGSIPFLDRKRGMADAVVNESHYHYDPYLCTVWIGVRSIILIQDFSLAKELFSLDEISGRVAGYHDMFIRGIDGECLGIVTTMDKFWQEQRRFTLKNLKDLGFGKNKLDIVIQDEANILIDQLISNSKTGDILIDTLFNFPIINILWQIVASKKYDPELPESKNMMKKVGLVFLKGPSLVNFFIESRFLRSFMPLEQEKAELELKELFRQQILEHEKELEIDESRESNDFIDMYLKEIKQKSYEKNYQSDGTYKNFNIEQLVVICLDLFQAGSETSSTTLSWAVMYLALYPEVEAKCHEEIELVLGGKERTKWDRYP